jgi:hypothetical protein
VTARSAEVSARSRVREGAVDRAGIEASRLDVRGRAAAVDAAFRILADASSIPWLDPLPETFTVATLRPSVPPAGGPIAGIWIRSPESLDLHLSSADGVGRTTCELRHRSGATWTAVATQVVAIVDGTEALLLPVVGSTGWPAGDYRLRLTYRRDLTTTPEDDRSDLPVEQRFGSDAPEVAWVDWSV